MNRWLISVVLVFAAFAVAADAAAPSTPKPEPEPKPIVIKVADMEREFVHVRTQPGKQGAELTFFFRNKSKKERNELFFNAGQRPVQIKDGDHQISECRASGLSERRRPQGGIQYGLNLNFDSVEEAHRVAKTIQFIPR